MAAPLFAGAVQVRITWPLPSVPATLLGVPATARGVAGADLVEYVLDPAAFTAATWKVYAVPLSRPVTFVEVSVDGERVTVVQLEEEVHHCNV